MKKALLLSTLVSPFCMQAADMCEMEQAKKDARMVTYQVTIYHDKEYDKERWDGILDDAMNAVKRGKSMKEDDSATEVVNAFMRGIERAYSRDDKEQDGIHGQMSISISDGSEMRTKGSCMNENDAEECQRIMQEKCPEMSEACKKMCEGKSEEECKQMMQECKKMCAEKCPKA